MQIQAVDTMQYAKRTAFRSLPVRVVPHPWEDLASFVSRVATDMGYKNSAWLLRPEEIPSTLQPFNLCLLRKEADYRFLEQLLRIDEETIYLLTLHRFTSSVQAPQPSSKMAEGLVQRPLLTRYIFQSFFHPYSATKICPHCIAEEPTYGHLAWNAAPVAACLRHEIVLLDSCPSCNHSIPALRPSLTQCPYCPAGDYRRAQAMTLPRDEFFLEGQRHILKCLEVENGSLEGATHCGASPLFDLLPWQYFQLLDAFRHVLGPLFPDASFLRIAPEFRNLLRHHSRTHSRLSPLEWIALIATFHEIFFSWPDQFFIFLDMFPQAREGRVRKRDQARLTGVQRDFGVFYEKWLYKRLSESAFTFLHEAFESYLKRHYTRGEVTNRLLPFRDKSKQQGQERPFLTKVQVRAVLGIGEEVLQTLIRQGVLRVQKSPIGQNGKRSMYLIDEASVEAVRMKWDSLLPLNIVARSYLGVSKGVVLALEQTSLLVPTRGPRVDGYRHRLYRSADVECFTSRLLRCAVKIAVPESQMSTLSQFACNMSISLITILTDILDGQLIPVEIASVQPVIHRLALPSSEMQRYLCERERRRRDDLGLLKVHEAAALLSIDRAVLLCWIQQGYLPTRRISERGKKPSYLIQREALRDFHERYLLTEEVAHYLGIVRSTVRKYVRKGVLHPVSGQKFGDGCNRLLFRREDVEAVLPPESLTVREAAVILGLSRSRLYILIKTGKLEHVEFLKGSSRTIRLLLADVESYSHK